jgi:hypothetical protein
MTDSDIDQILRREASLDTVSVRAVPDTVLAILDEEFVEIDRVGRIWNAAGVSEALSRNTEPHDGDMESTRVVRLSDDVYLVTYSSQNTSPSGDDLIRHTSVWVRKDGGWRVVFHQQTQVS